jgi:hypothetical protein
VNRSHHTSDQAQLEILLTVIVVSPEGGGCVDHPAEWCVCHVTDLACGSGAVTDVSWQPPASMFIAIKIDAEGYVKKSVLARNVKRPQCKSIRSVQVHWWSLSLGYKSDTRATQL